MSGSLILVLFSLGSFPYVHLSCQALMYIILYYIILLYDIPLEACLFSNERQKKMV